MLFIETRTFSKLLPAYLSDEDLLLLQEYLLQQPDAGSLIRGSGGLRKIQWAGDLKNRHKGKSGGVRIIYFWKKTADEIWLLTVYSKSERANISTKDLKEISRNLKDDESQSW
ncbi:MAG: type II toxin-antitoxin system RelE/ParE family toxin [Gammaproteobacteria bacterium]